MPYELEETGDLSRTATVTVPYSEYQQKMNSALKEIADDVDLSGFRKGKVPLSVVKRKYGRQVQGDVVEELVREGIDDLLEDHREHILYLGQPEVTQLPGDEDEQALEFSVDLEFRPDVDPVGYLGLTVEQPQPEVDDAEVDEQLDQMREHFASEEPLEFRNTIEEGDVVTFDFEPVDDDPAYQDFHDEDVEIEVGADQILPEIEQALEGADTDATVTTTITIDEGYPEEQLRGNEVELRLNVKSVKQKVLPDLNDAFARETGQAETMLELRSQIRESIEEDKQHRAEHRAQDNVVDSLVDQHDITLPPNFLDQQVEREMERRKEMFEQQGVDIEALGLDDDEFAETTREDVRENIKAEFLLTSIAEKEGVEVEEEDLDAFFEHQAQHQQFGAEQLKQYYKQDDERWESAVYQAQMEKTKKLLLSEAEIEDVAWSEAFDEPEAEGLDEDSSEAEGLDEDSSEAEGLDEDSSEADQD